MCTDGRGVLARLAFGAMFPIARPLFRRQLGMSELARARDRLAGYFDRLESAIGPSGYLVGDRFSIADLTAAAVMTAIIRPPQFSYALPEPWPSELVELRATVAHRPGVRWVLDIYERHRGASAEVSADSPAAALEPARDRA
jgi:glutathione S-transferase